MRLNSDFMWSIYLILVASLFFYFGNIIGVSETKNQISKDLIEKKEEIKILQKQNQQLSEELTSRGIYSYPQASIVSSKNDTLVNILITLNGKSPLTDLKVVRSHIYNYTGVEKEEARKIDPAIKTTNLGTLKTHNPAGFQINLKDDAAIHLEYRSGNKKWTQYLRVKNSPEHGISSFWIITNKNDEVIDKHVDEGFPVEDDGSILVWKNKKVRYSDIEMNSPLRL